MKKLEPWPVRFLKVVETVYAIMLACFIGFIILILFASYAFSCFFPSHQWPMEITAKAEGLATIAHKFWIATLVILFPLFYQTIKAKMGELKRVGRHGVDFQVTDTKQPPMEQKDK